MISHAARMTVLKSELPRVNIFYFLSSFPFKYLFFFCLLPLILSAPKSTPFKKVILVFQKLSLFCCVLSELSTPPGLGGGDVSARKHRSLGKPWRRSTALGQRRKPSGAASYAVLEQVLGEK